MLKFVSISKALTGEVIDKITVAGYNKPGAKPEAVVGP